MAMLGAFSFKVATAGEEATVDCALSIIGLPAHLLIVSAGTVAHLAQVEKLELLVVWVEATKGPRYQGVADAISPQA